MPRYNVDDAAQYYSASKGRWVDAVVTAVCPGGEVQVSCKPGYWMPLQEQAERLRPKCSGPSDAGASAGPAQKQWSTDQFVGLGRHIDEGHYQDVLLDASQCKSASSAVEGLNSGAIKRPEGICVVFSASSQAYYLLYRHDRKQLALARAAAAPTAKAEGHAHGVPHAYVPAPRHGGAHELDAGRQRAAPAVEPVHQQPAEAAAPAAIKASSDAPTPEAQQQPSGRLPGRLELEDPRVDYRERFMELRAWVKAQQHEKLLLANTALGLDVGHRRSVLAFLCEVPVKKRIFAAQAREILQLLADVPEWRGGGADASVDIEAALLQKDPPRPGPRGTAPTAPSGPEDQSFPVHDEPQDDGVRSSTAELPLPLPGGFGEAAKDAPMLTLAPEPEETPASLLASMPPPEAFEECSRYDAGDTFKEFRKWSRRSVLAFLCEVPVKKRIFAAQAREILQLLADVPEWRGGGADASVDIEAALLQKDPPRPGPRGTAPTAPSGPEDQSFPVHDEPQDDGVRSSTAELPLPLPGGFGEAAKDAPMLTLAPEPEETPASLLASMPPPEAFEECSRYDAGDTFKEFRKWSRSVAVWDMAAAGTQLPPEVRQQMFQFLTKICNRKLYSKQGVELLSMLLTLPEWTDGDVVDEAAVMRVLDVQDQPPAPQPPAPQPAAARAPSPPEKSPLDAGLHQLPVAPPRQPAAGDGAQQPRDRRTAPAPTPAPVPDPPAQPSRGRPVDSPAPAPSKARSSGGAGLQARVEAAVRDGMPISSGNELVRLYKESGLGGQASLSVKAADADAVRYILAITGQRLRDLFVDKLQKIAIGSGVRVHFPHLYINLQARKVHPMPTDVQLQVEAKIRRLERWTSLEKAHVLMAPHKQTLCYILAYAITRAKERQRAAIWIPLGMDTGAQGHANALCLQSVDGSGTMKVLCYDPNYKEGQTHFVHSKKAVEDALPGVRKLLNGTGLGVASGCELFGNAIQTALGTTERHKGWFSSKVTITQRGYPICGSVVFLLASVWLTTGTGPVPGDIVEVEAALAAIVSSGEEGKALVQKRIAKILDDLIRNLGCDASDWNRRDWTQSVRARLDHDRKDWKESATSRGGSVTVGIPGRKEFTYSW